jgi:hypothetical protein
MSEKEEQMHNLNPHKRSACPCGLPSFVTTTLTLLALAIGQAGSARAEGMKVTLMTQNMYVGSAFSALRSVTTVDDLKAAVTQIYNNILASKPKERAIAVAKEIKRERPDIITLQEAWILRTGSAGAPATKVKSDQLEELLNELRQQGLPYEAIAILPNSDFQAPTQARLRRSAHRPDGDHCAGRPESEARKYAGSGLPREQRGDTPGRRSSHQQARLGIS